MTRQSVTLVGWLTAIVVLSSAPSGGGEPTTVPSIILVVGASGTPEYAEMFEEWSGRWQQFADRLSAEVAIVGLSDQQSPNDRQQLSDAIRRESAEVKKPLLIVFVGHGTDFQGKSNFNLRGPDVSDKELAVWLNDVKRPLAIVQCASSSAPFLSSLSARKRVVITATRSQSEQNFARFGDFFSLALEDPAADLDHDQTISLLETFLLASNRVENFYRQDSRLATEHSLLDDNGDGLGVSANFFRGIRAEKSARDGSPLDGLRAHQFILFRMPGHVGLPPAKVKERDALEEQVEALREQKSQLPADEYFARLEPLMIQLARLYQAADNSD